MTLKSRKTVYLNALLFILTFFTTTLAGVQWLNKDPLELSNFHLGLSYSICLITVLSFHEFGHFFAARFYNINTSLPYYIPLPPFWVNPFGTMGAVIRIRSVWTSKKSLFDIGIAGPISGFIISMIILLYGFITLPDKNYLFTIHPEYRNLDHLPEGGLTFGNSILFWGISKLFNFLKFVPPMNEIYHYPFLCVGWFGLFITALNLMPVGQLDGGHIFYSMIGAKKQRIIARTFFISLIILGVSSFIPFFTYKLHLAPTGWLLWAILLYFVVKLDHPVVIDSTELTPVRKILGWVMFAIFVLTFTPIPFLDPTLFQ